MMISTRLSDETVDLTSVDAPWHGGWFVTFGHSPSSTGSQHAKPPGHCVENDTGAGKLGGYHIEELGDLVFIKVHEQTLGNEQSSLVMGFDFIYPLVKVKRGHGKVLMLCIRGDEVFPQLDGFGQVNGKKVKPLISKSVTLSFQTFSKAHDEDVLVRFQFCSVLRDIFIKNSRAKSYHAMIGPKELFEIHFLAQSIVDLDALGVVQQTLAFHLPRFTLSMLERPQRGER